MDCGLGLGRGPCIGEGAYLEREVGARTRGLMLDRIPRLYHFTDRRNLNSIKQYGGLYSLAKLEEMEVTVPAPGGNDWSHDADRMKGLHTFVHLCFRSNHPMEYRAREEGRIQDSLFLEIHPEVLSWDGVLFAPDVSNKAGVDCQSFPDAVGMIDFEVLYTRTDWNDPAIQERLQKAERCEVLVPDHIPIRLIRNVPNG